MFVKLAMSFTGLLLAFFSFAMPSRSAPPDSLGNAACIGVANLPNALVCFNSAACTAPPACQVAPENTNFVLFGVPLQGDVCSCLTDGFDDCCTVAKVGPFGPFTFFFTAGGCNDAAHPQCPVPGGCLLVINLINGQVRATCV